MNKAAAENSYRNILKGVSIFGGVKVFEILVNLLRGKFVAMFLGPAGMGVSQMFVTSSQTIQKMASCGLNLAFVKEIAACKDDRDATATLLAVVNRLLMFTSLAGAAVCILLSGWLSRWSFGDGSYTWQFVLLGAMVFFSILGTGQQALLQGAHEMKRLSKATLVGSLTGLFAGVPLYYFFGTGGIVPAMIILAVAMWAFYYVSVRKTLGRSTVRLVWAEHKPLVRKLFMIGMVLVASEAISSLCSYLTNLYVRVEGNLEDVGLWQAANSVTMQYSGIVFASLLMDYLPRLAAVAKSNAKMAIVVNRQSEIVALIIAPIAAAVIMFAPLAVSILLTGDFARSIPLIRWFAMGLTFKALMFPLGYLTFAKDNRKVFFWLEGVSGNLLQLLWGCLFFCLFGLEGLGYAMVCDCAVCLLIYYVVNRRLYGFRFTRRSLRAGAYSIAISGAALGCSYIQNEVVAYCGMAICVTLGVVISAIMVRPLLKK